MVYIEVSSRNYYMKNIQWLIKLARVLSLENKLEDYLRDFFMREYEERFCYEGNPVYHCFEDIPHTPQVVGGYDTVNNGWLQYFCRGREGILKTPFGYIEVKIYVDTDIPGDAYTPARYCGKWRIKPVSCRRAKESKVYDVRDIELH